MTEKQERILEKYLTDDHIKALDDSGFEAVSAFINLIMQTTRRTAGGCSVSFIPVLERRPTEQEREQIEKKLNKDRKSYGLLPDEYVSVKTVRYYYGGPAWYDAMQTWYKGEGNSLSCKIARVSVDGEALKSTYDTMYDMGIRSVHGLLKYCENAMQQLSGEKRIPFNI